MIKYQTCIKIENNLMKSHMIPGANRFHWVSWLVCEVMPLGRKSNDFLNHNITMHNIISCFTSESCEVLVTHFISKWAIPNFKCTSAISEKGGQLAYSTKSNSQLWLRHKCFPTCWKTSWRIVIVMHIYSHKFNTAPVTFPDAESLPNQWWSDDTCCCNMN